MNKPVVSSNKEAAQLNRTYKVLSAVLVRLMRPLARLMLRNGVTFHAFADLAKVVFVEIAATEFTIHGRKQSDSRISVITGLTRKDVKYITQAEPPDNVENFVRYNRAARVISGWIQDTKFTDKRGNPLDLPLDGAAPTFGDLVRSYSGDAPARAVLDELERVGAVIRVADNKISLLSRAYLPQTDDVEKIAVIGSAVGTLLETIDNNCFTGEGKPFFQRHIENRLIPTDAAAEFHMMARRKGQQLLETLDRWLSDREVKDHRKATLLETKHVGLGMYYFEEER